MSTKRTVINADEELVIKGKLTIEGNVTQIETTQQVTNLEGNVFTINSDGSNTSAVLVLNSNGTVASFTFDDSNGSIVVNKPINFGSGNIVTSGNITAPNFIGNVTGNVTGYVSTISNFTTTDLREGANLYYTVSRANSAIDARLPNTDALSEGSANLYYTVARANSAIESYLVGGDGIDYASGTIDVDNTVVRTTGDQTITGNTSFYGTTYLTGDIFPTSNGAGNIGSESNHFDAIYATKIHTELLDLADADIADIHNRFVAGVVDSPYLTTNTANGLIYTHNASIAGYAVVTGNGLEIDGNGALTIDNTVITTAGGQTINGDLTLTGNLVLVNIDSQTQTDSLVSDKVLYLNVGGGASPNNSRVSVEKTAANVYLEYDSRWKFTNDGANVNNMLLFTDFAAGNGLSYDNAGSYTVLAGDGISVGANVAVDSTVVRTSGNQNISGIKNFTGELVIPSSFPTQNNTIYVNAGNTAVFANVNGVHVQLTSDSDVGQVEDVGATGIDIYAGSNAVTLGNNTIYYHGIRSIDDGTYTTLSESANVITVDANITAIRGAFSAANIAGYGGIGYDSANGVFNYSGVTDAQIRGLFSGAGLITYNSANGSITTSADNYGSWTVQTDSGAGAAEAISSGEKLIIQSGTGIAVTNAGNVITITNSNTADITGVSAGNGLVGGGNSGDVTLNIGAGEGITVNADDVAVNVSYVRSQFSASGDLTYNASTGVFSFTNDAGDIEGVTAGNGLVGGGTSGTVTLDIGAGTGITVNTDNIAVNMSAFSTTDLAEGANLYFTTNRANSAMDAYLIGGNGLTYSSGTFAVGAGAGITVNADNVALTSGIVTSGTYGTASAVPAVTVDTYGRVTNVSNTSISITASQVSDFTSSANTAIDARVSGGNGLTYSGGILAVGAGSYITVGADTVAVDASTTNTAGKVVARDGSGNVYANYFVGTATAAQYADLAENYLADADYLPGTVLVFGGEAEVTACISYESTRVAGVVTTQPAHVMNSHLTGPNVACIALRGRVPVKVKGVVRKGDVLVTAGEGHVGYAVASLDSRSVPAASIVGKAITDKLDNGPGVVEALI